MAMLWLVLALMPQAGTGKPAAPPPNPSLIRIHVDTDSDDIKELETSIKDLTEAINARKKSLVTVDDEDKADVTVQVIQRVVEVPKVVIGLGPRPGEPPGMTTVKTARLQVQLRFEAIQVSLQNKNKVYDNPGGWRSAAEDLAEQIDKWVGQYRAEIIRNRR
jgi:hypothetical protein